MYEIFIIKGLSLVAPNGFFSFIVPDRLCYNEQFKELRKKILENYTIKKLWFKPKFPDIIGDTVVFIIQNKRPKDNYIEISEYPSYNFYKIPQKTYGLTSDCTWFYVSKEILSIFEKIRKNSKTKSLADFFQSKVGFIARPGSLTQSQEKPSQIRVLKGGNISRFSKSKNWWFNFEKRNLVGGTQDIEKLGKKYKVLLSKTTPVSKTGQYLKATFDDSGIFPEQSLYFIYTEEDKNKEDLIYLTGLLNSTLMDVYYRNFAITNRDATPQLKKMDLDKFPIIIPSRDIKEKINLIVLELMGLQKPYLSICARIANSDASKKGYYDLVEEKTKMKTDIDRLELKLNEIVYEIYNVIGEEKEIIEKSL